jgi:hypothetical protein
MEGTSSVCLTTPQAKAQRDSQGSLSKTGSNAYLYENAPEL